MLLEYVDANKKYLVDDDTAAQTHKWAHLALRVTFRHHRFYACDADGKNGADTADITNSCVVAVCLNIGYVLDKQYHHLVAVVDTYLPHKQKHLCVNNLLPLLGQMALKIYEHSLARWGASTHFTPPESGEGS